ncbi:circularly permutated Ras protein 1 [Erpetoichthys calabaricus]|uniref:Si:dkey-9k7.3 n=1 Tax=Erpetoichthys calabaricus TaxID=27687 RepID=A0A8C4SP24_ERPCA|nr:circularly permutated Ras protein 1 [Erpetoichthys calabaricus]
MEFACSHVVCNWQPSPQDRLLGRNDSAATSWGRSTSGSVHDYDNRIAVIPKRNDRLLADGSARPEIPPPLPPRQKNRHGPARSPQVDHRPSVGVPPPLPPRSNGGRSKSGLNANVNVFSVNMGKLADFKKSDVPIINDQPLCCTYCSAALSPFSTQCQQKGDVVWRCDFCYKHNQSSGRICGSPNTDVHDIIYLSQEEDGDYVNLDDLLIVFCVDISGSMCVTTKVDVSTKLATPVHVSRLQSVQDAIQNSLSFLLKTYRHRRVALVTFNDKVTVYGDGMVTPLMLSEWGLMDYTFLKSQGENFTTPHCIAESVDNLRHKVQEMREYGPTALGPAALVSIALASRYSGSKVIICTDGLANIGLGYLNPKEEAPSETATYFYKSLAEEAVAKGVIVSVLTFEGTDCRLSELGQLADRTGGRVNIVNINNLSSEIQIILEDNVVATDVTATLFLPEGMYFRYEDHADHKLLREIGNVTDDLEVTFEFGIKESSLEAIAKREKVPFQLQLSFKTRDLQRATRIITLEKNVILTSFLTEDNLNMEVLKVHFAQLSARLTMQGRVKEAQEQVLAQQELLRTIGRQNPINTEDDIYENWMRTMAVICDDLTKTTENKSSLDMKEDNNSAFKVLSDEVANVVYHLKRAKSIVMKKSVH